MARILDGVSSHEGLIDRLLSAKKRDCLPSTFLFTGPSGVGRKKVALGLVQALVCEVSERGCGECGPCLRVARGQSEALLVIEPEKTQIKIEQSREILDFFSLRAVSKARAVIIDGAEFLNSQAANALLKILEEPPPHSYFFLIAPSTRHVLPTLRSRSQVVRFGALSEQDLRRNRPAPEWALKAAMGSFDRLSGFLDKDEMQLRQTAWQVLAKWRGAEPLPLDPDSREWMRDRAVLLRLARHWLLAFRDALFLQAGERERLFNSDRLQEIEKLAAQGADKLGFWMKQSFELEQALLSQRDPQLSFEQFWIASKRRQEV